jgi:hypothetical protein
MKILTFPLAAIVTLLVLVPRSARAQSFSGPHCLGRCCIGQPVLADRFVSEIEEPGNKISFWRFLAVYKSKDGSACLDVREAPNVADNIASITLQATSRCPGEISKKNLADWKTPEGIALRSLEQDVPRPYGKPSEEPERAWGSPSACSKAKPFSYIGILKGSKRAVRFGIRNGRVSCINFSNLEYSGPECLGPICRTKSQPIAQVLAQLGVPKSQVPVAGSYCLQSSGGQRFLSLWKGRNDPLGTDEVEVVPADFRNCMHRPANVANGELHAWTTAEGIRLGSSEQDVLKAYGKHPKDSKFIENGPHFEITGFRDGDKLPNVADKLITYYGLYGTGRAEFGIRAGRASYIWFSGHA